MSSAGVKGPWKDAGSGHMSPPKDSTDTNREEPSMNLVSTPRTARLLEHSSATTRTPPSFMCMREDDFMRDLLEKRDSPVDAARGRSGRVGPLD
jgi:hypothetical protein